MRATIFTPGASLAGRPTISPPIDQPYCACPLFGLGDDSLNPADDLGRNRFFQGILAPTIVTARPVFAALRMAETNRTATDRAREIFEGLPGRLRAISTFTSRRLIASRRGSSAIYPTMAGAEVLMRDRWILRERFT